MGGREDGRERERGGSGEKEGKAWGGQRGQGGERKGEGREWEREGRGRKRVGSGRGREREGEGKEGGRIHHIQLSVAEGGSNRTDITFAFMPPRPVLDFCPMVIEWNIPG